MARKKRSALPTLSHPSYLVDSHCHLDMAPYGDDLDSVLSRAAVNNVMGVVTIGTDLRSSYEAVKLAQKCPMIRATVGVHPHDAAQVQQGDFDKLIRLVNKYRKVIVGYGEIGLDYAKQYSPPDVQRTVFRRQLQIAKELELPIIIHDRDAHEDCLKIITEEGPFANGGIMHCFSGDLDFSKKILDRNLHISIPGIVTYKNAIELQEVASKIPLDRMLVETDGPFLAPVPYRGKRNEPLYTLYIAEAIAALREITIEEIADRTSSNACELFKYQFAEAL